jgi:hypothetical protein
MRDLRRLKAKLCNELSQTERSARLHSRREARRLGDGPAASALLAISEHADQHWPRVQTLCRSRQTSGGRLGSLVGRVFSGIRYGLVDRVVDLERSYRGTLLGYHHGIGIVRLLAEIASRDDDAHLLAFCNEWLSERGVLVERAERALSWFAERPSLSVRSGLRLLPR